MKLQLINSIRTNNFNDEQMIEKIRTIWEEASRKLEQHQNSIYGVYFQYESDYKGDYSLGVGIEGDGVNHIEIPDNEHYKIFKVDTGNELGIVHAWKKIWELEEAGTLKRA